MSPGFGGRCLEGGGICSCRPPAVEEHSLCLLGGLLSAELMPGHGARVLGRGPTPFSPLGKCWPTKQRQPEQSWPSSWRWAWPSEPPSPSCSKSSSSRGTQRVQGHRDGSASSSSEALDTSAPRGRSAPRLPPSWQTLHPGTVPLLQGWPGSCHAWPCAAFRPTCLRLPRAACKTPGTPPRSRCLPCCETPPAQGRQPC